MAGWIKLHREVMNSTTFRTLTLKQKMIAIYLILNANHEDGIWTDNFKGIQVEIKRGQVIISPQKIADEWFKDDKEITRQVVRTTLAKLSKLDFLTMYPTNNYTLINIEKYSVYQAKENEDNQVPNQVLTKSQPSLNQVLTTNKNVKNVKKEKKDLKTIRPKVAPSDIDFGNANLLFEWRLKNFPNTKKPNLEKWANDFRLLREVDHALQKDVKYIIEWSQKNTFWKSNIKSADKFRKQYDTLYIQAEEEFKKQSNVVPMHKKQDDYDELIERLKKEQQQGAIEE